ncbi:MAG: hypothetical protein FJZ67_03160 [Bacteroidetes bacterium]|nr:hypothetical protein [Bacteroidota bacterium]
MSGLFDSPFFNSLVFKKLLTYSRIFSLVIFGLGSISIVAHLLFSSPRIPGDLIFFEVGLMTFSVYFIYSIFKAGLNLFERLFYGWFCIFMISIIFSIMHWPGTNFLLVLNFVGLVGLLVVSIFKRQAKIHFPTEDAVLVFSILVTVIIFLFLTPKMMEKYRKLEEAYERGEKIEINK